MTFLFFSFRELPPPLDILFTFSITFSDLPPFPFFQITLLRLVAVQSLGQAVFSQCFASFPFCPFFFPSWYFFDVPLHDHLFSSPLFSFFFVLFSVFSPIWFLGNKRVRSFCSDHPNEFSVKLSITIVTTLCNLGTPLPLPHLLGEAFSIFFFAISPSSPFF